MNDMLIDMVEANTTMATVLQEDMLAVGMVIRHGVTPQEDEVIVVDMMVVAVVTRIIPALKQVQVTLDNDFSGEGGGYINDRSVGDGE